MPTNIAAIVRVEAFLARLVMIVMAAGIACFGVYCFFWARMARY